VPTVCDPTEAVRRAIGAFVPRRSELRRRSDRIEVGARWALLLLGLLLVPVALSIGSEVTARLEPQVAAQQADRRTVRAEVLDAPTDEAPESAAGSWRAPAAWIAADGTRRVAPIRVPAEVRTGDVRTIWVDTQDRLTAAPMPPGHPAGQGFLTTMTILLGDLVLSLVLLAGLRWVLDRARLREWEAAWRRFTGPDHESTR
jgi:hypothetical protein